MKWQDLNQQFLISTETIEHIQPDNCTYPLELLRHVSAHEQEHTPVLFYTVFLLAHGVGSISCPILPTMGGMHGR